MASTQFVLPLHVGLILVETAQTQTLKFSSYVKQEKSFMSVKAGENVTLECFCEGEIASRYFWYKQTSGQKPHLISSFYRFDPSGVFHGEFKNNPRFTLDTEKGKNHLMITDLQISDSAAYYCASSYSYRFEFGEGAIVNVEGSGSKVQTLVHNSTSGTIQPGGSVSLMCTVQAEACDGEHRVYWFKDSEETLPRIIYSLGGNKDQCEKRPNTQTHTCVYNLQLDNLNVSNAGMYYCAVASCGLLLFGNGTKLEFEDERDTNVSVSILRGALAFTTCLSVFQAFLLCLIYKGIIWKSKQSSRSSQPAATSQGDQSGENLHYSTLKHQKVEGSRRQRNEKDDCVYSSVKQ